MMIHRGIDFEAILKANLIVFLSVTRRSMYATGSLIERDMLAEDNR